MLVLMLDGGGGVAEGVAVGVAKAMAESIREGPEGFWEELPEAVRLQGLLDCISSALLERREIGFKP